MARTSVSPWLKLVVPLSAIGIGLLGLFEVLGRRELFVLLLLAIFYTLYLIRRQLSQLHESAG